MPCLVNNPAIWTEYVGVRVRVCQIVSTSDGGHVWQGRGRTRAGTETAAVTTVNFFFIIVQDREQNKLTQAANSIHGLILFKMFSVII